MRAKHGNQWGEQRREIVWDRKSQRREIPLPVRDHANLIKKAGESRCLLWRDNTRGCGFVPSPNVARFSGLSCYRYLPVFLLLATPVFFFQTTEFGTYSISHLFRFTGYRINSIFHLLLDFWFDFSALE